MTLTANDLFIDCPLLDLDATLELAGRQNHNMISLIGRFRRTDVAETQPLIQLSYVTRD